MKKSPSKQKVVNAAITLFFQRGFDGTSVRDIADEAGVNVSLISYYFKGKQGLLEYAITNYYEQYLEKMDKLLKQTTSYEPLERLKKLVQEIINFKQSSLQLSCTIHRELSLDTMFVREMTVTYLAKENYMLDQLLTNLLKNKGIDEKRYIHLQLKGMLISPYILHQEWRQHFVGDYSQKLFVKNYVKSIHHWLDFLAEKP